MSDEGDETTQLDLSAELDRLSAMTGDGDGDGDTDPDDPALRLSLHEATLQPEGVTGHELRALCTDGPADLRGRRVGVALHALHGDATRYERGADAVSAETLVDAVGGPALDDGYVVDREAGTVLAVASAGDPLVLAVADSSPVGEAGTERRVAASAVATATVAGYRDRARYRRYDAYGRPD